MFSDEYPRTRTTELQEFFEDITQIVISLFKLSSTIRQSKSHVRLLKSQSIDVSYFEMFDINHVMEKFPIVSWHLAERLARATLRRRQYLAYLESHHSKLAQPQELFQEYNSAVESTIEGPVNVVNDTQLSTTTATEYNPKSSNSAAELRSSSDYSQTSYTMSCDFHQKLHIPPQPKASLDQTPFECPICFLVTIIPSSRNWMWVCSYHMMLTCLFVWRKHVFRDLQPYVCTFEDCVVGDTLFPSRHKWFAHESKVHGLATEWRCICKKKFQSRSFLKSHLNECHSSSFTNEEQIEIIVSMCAKPLASSHFTTCSLCGDRCTIGRLERHVARHLEELALFALPRRLYDEE